MRDAFEKAGVKHPREQLEELFKAATEKTKGSIEATYEAFDKLVTTANDARLERELIGAIRRRQAIQDFAREMFPKLREEAPRPVEAKAPDTEEISRAVGGTKRQERAEVITMPPRGRSTAAISAVVAAARRSLLDTFIVNGRPIGDASADEANRWCASRERDARWVRLLTQNLPPTARIRDFRSAEEADKLYEEAQRERDYA